MITGGSGLGQLITARHMVLAGYINYVIVNSDNKCNAHGA